MSRWFTALCVLGLLAAGARAEEAQRPLVLRATLDDQMINPGTARYVERAIRTAEDEKAECLVLVLDTPGGMLDSTRRIVKAILSSRVPVIVYVAPSGARAASAGVFITLSAPIAAMAPGTNIGAAHPVAITGDLPGAPEKDAKDKEKKAAGSPMTEKIVNDTVAWARALAAQRGRDPDWVERTVRESESITATEAHEKGVIDLLADNFDDLLKQLDGRKVKLDGSEVTLRTTGAEVQDVEMTWGETVVALLAHPTLALLLLTLGALGILFELHSPGWGVPGTVGVICVVLGFAALAVLPINYAGLALLVVALAMFIAEVKVQSFGLLTLGGMVCLILGGVMLIDSPAGFERISLSVLVPLALACGAISFFLVSNIIRAHTRRVQTGGEALIGGGAVALDRFVPQDDVYVGQVRTQGETWRAVSHTPVEGNETLEIESRQGLTLFVRAVEPEIPSADAITRSQA
jgi:membrane-bound serine protease (ClpP class)